MVCLGYMLGMKTSHLYRDYHQKPAKSANLPQGSVEFLRSEKLTPPRSILGNSDGEVRPGVVVARPGGVGWLVGVKKHRKLVGYTSTHNHGSENWVPPIIQ